MSDTDVDADVHSLTASVYTGVVSADLVVCPELSAGRLGPGYTGTPIPAAATSSQPGVNLHGHSLPLMTTSTQPPLPAGTCSQRVPALVVYNNS